MPDVFISYSRKDGAFAKRLNNALTTLNRDVWIDWEDIPRGENWLNEIYSGIEAADTFLFVVSQHSLTSEICATEIAHARRHNKRILPLIRQKIEGDTEKIIKGTWVGLSWEQTARDNWDALRHINWVDMHDDAGFDEEFARLMQALEDDLPHRKAHTRYLVRALEWNRGARNPSYLLNGDEIDTAESWLAAADAQAKSPPANEFHRQFITESRRTADARAAQFAGIERRTRQFRRAAIAMGLVGALALIATIFAGLSSIQVSQQNATAQAEVAAARVEATAIQHNVMQNQSELNASLAQQALSRGEMKDALRFALLSAENHTQITDTGAAHQALLDVLSVPVREIASTDPANAIHGFELSPDNQLVLTWTEDGKASVRSLPDLAVRAETQLPSVIHGAAWSRDGSQLVIWTESTPFVWQTDGSQEPIAYDAESPFIYARFSPNAEWVIGRERAGYLSLFKVAYPAEPHATFTDAIYEHWLTDGRLMLTGDFGITIAESVNTPERQKLVTTLDDWLVVAGYSFSPDYSRIAYITWGGELWNASLDGATWKTTLETDTSPNNLQWSPDGQRLLVELVDTVVVWEGINNVTLGHRAAINGAVWNDDGSHVLSWSDDQTARVWDSMTGGELTVMEHHAPVVDAQYSSDETHILTTLRDGSIRVWSISDGTGFTVSHGQTVGRHTARWAGDRRVVTMADDKTLRLWSLENSGAVQFTPLPMQDQYDLLPDQNLVMTWAAGSPPIFWDITSGEYVATRWAETGPFEHGYVGININATGTHALLVPQSEPTLILSREPLPEIWIASLDPADPIPRVIRPDVPFTGVNWNVTGTVVTGLTQDDEILLYRTDPDLPVLRRHSPIEADVAWASPDGEHVLVWNATGGLILDMIDSAAPAIAINIPPSFEGIRWSPDENTLIVMSSSQASIWSVSGEQLHVLEPFAIRTVEFSPDGSLIALRRAGTSGNREVLIFEVGKRAIVSTLSINGDFNSLKWSPDGTRLIMIDQIRGIASVVPVNGDLALRLNVGLPSETFFPNVAFSADGKRVYSISGNGVQIWTVDFETLVALAEEQSR